MENLVDIVFKVFDLVEAEVSALQKKASNMLQALASLCLAVFLAMIGFFLLFYGIFLGLSLLMPPFLAAFFVAALAFLMGGGLLQCAKKRMS